MNRRLLWAELAFQAACFVAAVAAWQLGVPMTPLADGLVSGYVLLSFGYWLAAGWVFSRDSTFRRKALMAVAKPEGYVRPRRTGALVIAFVWLAFTVLEWSLFYIGWYRWYGVIMAQSVLYILNSLILRHRCPLARWVLNNPRGCCKDCTITAWDHAFFATPLLFVPAAGRWFPVVRILVVAVGFGIFLIWEVLYRKYPWRFTSDGNEALRCNRCAKKCAARSR